MSPTWPANAGVLKAPSRQSRYRNGDAVFVVAGPSLSANVSGNRRARRPAHRALTVVPVSNKPTTKSRRLLDHLVSRTNNVGGTVTPIALAVLRLIASPPSDLSDLETAIVLAQPWAARCQVGYRAQHFASITEDDPQLL